LREQPGWLRQIWGFAADIVGRKVGFLPLPGGFCRDVGFLPHRYAAAAPSNAMCHTESVRTALIID
jgi:hypothetical protein